MEINDFIEKFAEIFEDVDANNLKPETKFRELEEWSSLEALCVVSMADEEFGKQIKNTDLKACNTIEDLYNLITK